MAGNSLDSGADQPVNVPQLDVNDLEMDLREWVVDHGERVEKGQVLAVLDTAKASLDVVAPRGGIVALAAAAGTRVAVGQAIGWVGNRLPNPPSPPSPESTADDRSGVRVTPKAQRLAAAHGVEPETVPHEGRVVTEEDVQRFLDAGPLAPQEPPRRASDLPPWLSPLLDDETPLPKHRAHVARHLRQTQSELVSADLEMDVEVSAALQRAARCGPPVSLFHVVLWEVARALQKHPTLRSFRRGDRIHTYRSPSVAFTVATPSGGLVTPVVHPAESTTLEELALACAGRMLDAHRGTLRQADLVGGSFTVSMLTGLPVVRFRALQNQFQSAVLAIGEPTRQFRPDAAGQPSLCNLARLVVTYDHGLADGMVVGRFLNDLKLALERVDTPPGPTPGPVTP